MKRNDSATSAAVALARSRGRAHRDHQGELLHGGDAGADAKAFPGRARFGPGRPGRASARVRLPGGRPDGRRAWLRARRFGRGRARRLEVDVRQQRRRDHLGSQDLRQFPRVVVGAVLDAMTNDGLTVGLMNAREFQ